MFKFIKKKIFESIVKDIVKRIPELKLAGERYWEENKDEIIEKAKQAIRTAAKQKIRELVEKV